MSKTTIKGMGLIVVIGLTALQEVGHVRKNKENIG